MSKSSLVQVNVPAYAGNFTYGRSGRSIEAITIHHMAGVLTAEQCGAIFQQIGRYGSSHYGIGNDGKIASYVDEENTAWTNSNWDSNCKSVTIETSNSQTGGTWPVSDNALNSLIKLVADIAKRNNLGTLVPGKNLTWHSMFTNTTCPGDYLRSKMQYIADEANKINSPEKSLDEIVDEVIAGKWGNQPERQQRLEAAGYNYREVQDAVNARYAKPELAVGDKVQIIATGNGSSYGDSNAAYGVGWIRYITAIHEGRPFPYQVGNEGKTDSENTTGFYAKSALRRVD